MKTRAKWLIKSIAICNDTCCQSLINKQRLPKAKRFGPPRSDRAVTVRSKTEQDYFVPLLYFTPFRGRFGPDRSDAPEVLQRRASRTRSTLLPAIQSNCPPLSCPFPAARFLSLPPTPTLFSLPSIHLIVITTLPFTQIN